jgi:DNA repair protein RecO (recombination protein O)
MTMECEAIILQTSDYRENDKLVSFLTADQGRLRGVARGAKRSARRFGGILDTFSRLRLQVTPSQSLYSITGADPITIHGGIRQELGRIALAGYACELLERLVPEGMALPRLFRLLSALLAHLDSHDATPSDRRFFEANLLKILGYAHLEGRCDGCGGELSPTAPCFYRPGTLALFCQGCGINGRRLSGETVELLRQAHASGRFGAITFPPQALAEAAELLDSALAAHLSKPLRSLDFLREVGGM